MAKARAIDAQVKAYGGAEFRVIQEVTDKLADAIKNSKVDIVPKTVVHMGGAGGDSTVTDSTVMDTLLKFITLDKLGVQLDRSKEEVPEIMPRRRTAVADEAAAAVELPDQ